jgi:uncharacterized membrane protein YfcA
MDQSSSVSAAVSAAVATVIAILSGIGVGSGGLLVIWLTFIEGMGIDEARGFNLLFFIFSSGAALVFHIMRKRLKPKLVVILALFACVGTLVGTYLGTILDSGIIRKIFGGMLMLSGLYTLWGRRRRDSL